MNPPDYIKSDSEVNRHPGVFRGLYWLTWIILILPVIYVLSLGPAFHVLPLSVIGKVYGPLIRFEEHCPPLERFQTWYMEKVWRCPMW